MILDNQVEISADPRDVFDAIRDPNRIVACVPGAQLESSDGNIHQGRVKVKVGPITAQYSGTVEFTEINETEMIMRLSGRGNDVHGSGDAEASVEIRVTEAPAGALLLIHSDVTIRGKIAQFGKSAISAVANVILGQFAKNLSNLLSSEESSSAAASTSPVRPPGSTPSASGPIGTAPQDPGLDAFAVIVLPLARRFAGPVASILLAVGIGILIGRGRRRNVNPYWHELPGYRFSALTPPSSPEAAATPQSRSHSTSRRSWN